jgi:hypothetical protein
VEKELVACDFFNAQEQVVEKLINFTKVVSVLLILLVHCRVFHVVDCFEEVSECRCRKGAVRRESVGVAAVVRFWGVVSRVVSGKAAGKLLVSMSLVDLELMQSRALVIAQWDAKQVSKVEDLCIGSAGQGRGHGDVAIMAWRRFWVTAVFATAIIPETSTAQHE